MSDAVMKHIRITQYQCNSVLNTMSLVHSHTVVMLTCSYFNDRKSVPRVLCMGDVQTTMLVSSISNLHNIPTCLYSCTYAA